MDRLSTIRAICANEVRLAAFVKDLLEPTSPLLKVLDSQTARVAADLWKEAEKLTHGASSEYSPWFNLTKQISVLPPAPPRFAGTRQGLFDLLEALHLLATSGPVADRELRAELLAGGASGLHRLEYAAQATGATGFVGHLLAWHFSKYSALPTTIF